MSLSREQECTCPFCGAKQRFTFWEFLNLRDNPELYTALLTGDIFESACPECGRTARIGYPMVCYDPERKLVVGLIRSRDQANEFLTGLDSSDLLPPKLKGLTVRAVFQPPEMTEKLIAARNGLDDRVLEINKAPIFQEMVKETSITPDHIYFIDLESLRYLIVKDESKDIWYAEFDREAYDTTKERYAPFFPQSLKENLIVDREWVAGLMKPGGRTH